MLATTYFSRSFARSPGRFLTLFLNDRYDFDEPERNYDRNVPSQSGNFERYETEKGQGKQKPKWAKCLQDEIHDCCFPVCWSFIGCHLEMSREFVIFIAETY
jgi:hypothetical protein